MESQQRKIVVIGKERAGKTSLIRSYFGVHEFEEGYAPTTTSDFFSTTLTLDGTEISGSIWDIGGKSKMGRSFMRDTHGVMLVVDLSDKNELMDGLDRMYDDLVKLAGFADDSFPCHVIANKLDLVESGHDLDDMKRILDNWCSRRRTTPIAYTIASAKTGVDVEESITSLFRLAKGYKPRISKSRGSSIAMSPTILSEPTGTTDVSEEVSPQPTKGQEKEGKEMLHRDMEQIQAKLVIAGAAAVGKTSILKRFADGGDAVTDENMRKYDPTIGADFRMVTVPARDKMLKLEIWDTSGDRKMMSLGRSIYKNADYIILVYDITSAESFNALDTYYNNFVLYGNAEDPDAFPCILVGNKCDVGERATNLEDVLAWCAKKRPKRPITHIECSALRSIGVNDIFIIVAEAIVDYESYLDGEGSDSDDSSAGYKQHSFGNGSSGVDVDIALSSRRSPTPTATKQKPKSCIQDVTEQLSICSIM